MLPGGPTRLTPFRAVGLCVLLAATALLPSPGSVLAQQPAMTGELAGRVLDFDETPLRGVTVRLSGPGGLVQTAVTDGDARFLFTALPAGDYELAIDLPGIRATGDTEVTLTPGARLETTLGLSLLASEVTVNVTAAVDADTGIADADSTSGRSTLSADLLDRLPLPAEQALDALPVLPSVIRAPNGQLSIDGTWPSDSLLLFNGIDLMDPFSGEYRMRLPLEAVQEVEVYDGVYPAQYGQLLGGIVDISTAPGGDEWDFQVSSFFPRPRFNDGTIMGLKSASPRMRVSGPVADGLYLSQAAEYHFDRVKVEDVPGDPPVDYTKVQGWESLTQLDWQPNERHRSRLSLLAFPQFDEFAGLDGLTPPEATYDFERDAEAILARHEWRIDDRTSLELSTQYNRIGFMTSPQGAAPLEVTPTGLAGNGFHREDRQTTHFQAKGVYTRLYPRGENAAHLVQVGAELHELDFDGTFANGTILVKGVDGEILRTIEHLPATDLDQDKIEWSGFIQDRWSQGPRFWVDLGLRYSSDTVTDDPRFAPRVGAAWDPVGDGKTLVKAASGLLYRRLFLGEALWEQLPVRVETTRTADGGLSVAVLEPRLEGALTAPWSVLTTLELSHQATPDLQFRSRFSRREGRDQMIIDRVEPELLTLESGAEPLVAASTLVDDTDGALVLHNAGETSSWSLEVTVNYRWGARGELHGSYVRSSAEGDLNGFSLVAGEIPAAIIRPNQYGRLPFDAPHRVLLWGHFYLPWELTFSPVVEWRSGFPYSLFAEDQSYAGPANSERFPDFLAADAQLVRDFTFGDRTIRAGANVTNFLNRDNPRQVISNLATDRFGELRNGIPLKVRAKISFIF